MLQTVTTIEELRHAIKAWRRAGETVGLVPTMGALHQGHLALVRHSRAKATRTCVTLFINPAQFGEGEDFDDYPRDEAEDAAKLEKVGVALLFRPEAGEIYPPVSPPRSGWKAWAISWKENSGPVFSPASPPLLRNC